MGSYSDYMDFGRWDELIEKNRMKRLDDVMEEICGYTPGRGNFRNETSEPKPKKKLNRFKNHRKK